MTESKHTPGPWSIIVSKKDGSTDILGSDGIEIAGIVFERGNNNGYIEDEANACLIAVAPELLEALEAFKQVLDQDWGEDAIRAGFAPSMMLGSAIEKAKTVLAKIK